MATVLKSLDSLPAQKTASHQKLESKLPVLQVRHGAKRSLSDTSNTETTERQIKKLKPSIVKNESPDRTVQIRSKENEKNGAVPRRPLATDSTSGRPAQRKWGQLSAVSKPPAKAPPKFNVGFTTGRASCIEVGTASKTKRPKWDFKGRLQDAEEELKRCKQELIGTKQELIGTKQQRDVAVKEKQELDAGNVQVKKQLNKLKLENKALEEHFAKQKEELEAMCRKVQEYDAEKHLLASQIESVRAELCILKQRVEQGEQIRRQLHNQVQELKGNIRVFCRIRPMLNKELELGVPSLNFNLLTDQKMELWKTGESMTGRAKTSKHEFTFDKIFNQTAQQDLVFEEISHLVQSCVDGYNVCIFAYGQTGSGKTYTMEGAEDISDFIKEEDNPYVGMIPRAVKQVFSVTRDLVTSGWSYKIEASILEIYNETIQDLLVDRSLNAQVKYEIRMTESSKNDVFVTNLTTLPVTTVEEVYALLKRARKNRTVAAHKCNEHSSRSHCVFCLKLSGVNAVTGFKCEGRLNLVDLAGSERVKISGAEGVRFTEMKNINLSLSNLGNVIMALAQNAEHVPYRNSKLTHLLMPCLGGNSKTLMFVNVCPREDFLGETLNSLRFASKVNQCHIGTARKN